jgi:hypothetical protein
LFFIWFVFDQDLDIFDLSPVELARQWALGDQAAFCAVPPPEFRRGNWTLPR